MDTFLIKAFQLILSLSILVVLHEGGHFFFAKVFKVRVEKFFLFFDPKFHLFSTKDKWFTRLFPRFRNKETEYGIGWLPFGGYVKIAGMIDESMDTEQMKQPVQAWEFRSKPAWQRLFIMIGGVLVNFLLALVIYSSILFVWGEEYIPMKRMYMGFNFNEEAQTIGFRDGDVLISADGVAFQRLDGNVYRALSEAKTVTVKRRQKYVNISMPEDMDMLSMIRQVPAFLVPRIPSVVDSVPVGTPAYEAGLRSGCKINEVDGVKVYFWSDFDNLMSRKADMLATGCSREDSLRLRTMTVVYTTRDHRQTDTVEVCLTADYKLGVIKRSLSNYYKPIHVEYGFWESIPAGVRHGLSVLTGYVSDLKYVFTSDGVKSVGSFGTIGSIFPDVWDWQSFWGITAFLSIMLAFMNILPIPALDGGHVLFLLAEIIMRRPPSEKFMERAQMVGMTLLIALMLLACYNDIVRFLF
ncbi:MAG: RIP metalloprotease RseP [Paraprevotella sp.]|nr:RIP metalloprotease RseP [Paraprevotella sp.]